MAFDLSSIFGDNAYDTILRGILGVTPTGNPVKDAAYLVILPLLTLFLFSDHVSGLLHLHKTKLKWVFMGLVVFFIIESGFYPLLAKYSLFAFIVLLIWGAWTFITSAKVEEPGGKGGQVQRMETYNTASKKSWFGKAAQVMSGKYNMSVALDDYTGLSDAGLAQKEKEIKKQLNETNDPVKLEALSRALESLARLRERR